MHLDCSKKSFSLAIGIQDFLFKIKVSIKSFQVHVENFILMNNSEHYFK